MVQGFFVGMVANLFPFAPAGSAAVDAGMIGAFVLFDVPGSEVFAAVLIYRLIAFWLPIPPGIVAFLQLRKTVRPLGGAARRGADGRTRAPSRRRDRASPLLQKVKYDDEDDTETPSEMSEVNENGSRT